MKSPYPIRVLLLIIALTISACTGLPEIQAPPAPEEGHLISPAANDNPAAPDEHTGPGALLPESPAGIVSSADVPPPPASSDPVPAPDAMTFIVTTTDDLDYDTCNNPCSLREAINAANGNPGLDTIAFSIPGIAPYTIQPDSPLPEITDPVIIDGWTQAGFDGAPIIEIDGQNVPPEAPYAGYGLRLAAGSSTVRGLVLNRFNVVIINIEGGGGNVIEGNYIGTDVTGTQAVSNTYEGMFGVYGVMIVHSDGNRIGGTTPDSRNVISNNRTNVDIADTSTGNVIQGNYIGLDASGTAVIDTSINGMATEEGILVTAPGNQIGGVTPGVGNVITGNSNGVFVYGDYGNADGNIIQGNLIGTDATGTQSLASTTSSIGILVMGANDTLIGGTEPGAGNVVAVNAAGGIGIAAGGHVDVETDLPVYNTTIQGNLVGLNINGEQIPGPAQRYGIVLDGQVYDSLVGGMDAGAANTIAYNVEGGVYVHTNYYDTTPVELRYATGNQILGNHIFANGGLGIDLDADPTSDLELLPDGATPNDPGDPDIGANNLQNFPDLSAAYSGGSIAIEGSLNSAANTAYRLEFFANTTCNSSGYGEGETYLGYTDVTTDGSGNVSFETVFTSAIPPGYFVAATATDPDGNTSEFSPCQEVFEIQPLTVTTTDDIDDGSCDETHCSLREAITAANGNPGLDTIAFALPGIAPYTIQPAAALPEITDPVVIDGWTQMGSPGPPVIEIDGQNVPPDTPDSGTTGLRLAAGGSTVCGLVLNRFSEVIINIEGGGGNVIEGNYIGTDVTGTQAVSNTREGGFLVAGVRITDSDGNHIGGTTPDSRNVISNNLVNVLITGPSTGNMIQGNFIGLDATGTAVIDTSINGEPSRVGIGVGAPGNLIGGVTPGAGNVVTGNTYGIWIEGPDITDGNVVQGNLVGTDATGTQSLASTAELSGIDVTTSNDTLIGGTEPGAGNVVALNSAQGIGIVVFGFADYDDYSSYNTIIQGNLVGVNINGEQIPGLAQRYGIALSGQTFDSLVGGTEAGAANTIAYNVEGGIYVHTDCEDTTPIELRFATGNQILGNHIFANGGLGIDLDADPTPDLEPLPDGPTPNDPGDPDVGANNLQNFPDLSAAYSGGSIFIEGSLNSTASTAYRLEFFANTTCNPSGYGEGEIYLGFENVTTDANGDTSFSVSFPDDIPAGYFIAATATDPDGNTSEFSPCQEVFEIPPLTVNTTDDNDDGTCDEAHCSLREAINAANGSPGLDTIAFALPGDAPYTIQPATALPAITDPVIIDGWTQTGSPGPPVIEIDGQNVPTDDPYAGYGLRLAAGGSTVRGLVLNRFKGAIIRIDGGGGNVIEGNYIGTDVTGTQAVSNTFEGEFISGVWITNSNGNRVGGTTPDSRNVISNNETNVFINGTSTGNAIQGNYIGLDATGTAVIDTSINGKPSWAGIGVVAPGNLIGGVTPGAGNVITGNLAGINFQGYNNDNGNIIQGNLIGTDATGTQSLASTAGSAGIYIATANDTLIGGTEPGAGNVVAVNSAQGIGIVVSGFADYDDYSSYNTIIQGNLIGLNINGEQIPGLAQRYGIILGGQVFDSLVGGTDAGAANTIAYNVEGGVYVATNYNEATPVEMRFATGNQILENRIFANGGLGIDLDADPTPDLEPQPDGPTPNDPGDPDIGANNLQNFPELSAAYSGGSIFIEGSLNSTPETTFRLEFFANATCNPSGYGEGETYLGFENVTTDANGDTSFSVTFPDDIPAGHFIAATATDPDGNTSEFSECEEVVEEPPCYAVTEIPLSECLALQTLYNSTGGDGWTDNTDWLATDTPCGWYGVTCAGGHVTGISLDDNNLVSTIPADLADLPYLTDLSLSGNLLSGGIPLELTTLPNLLYLNLSYNQLGGPIPAEMGNLTTLDSLDLTNNQFAGPIPASFGQLTALDELLLGNNLLTGNLPPVLGSLAELYSFQIQNNALVGDIPSALSDLTNLSSSCDFDYNGLTASDPAVAALFDSADPGWSETQTVAPTDLLALGSTSADVQLTWTPIAYTADGGFYEVGYALSPGGPFTVVGVTDDKFASSYDVGGLEPGATTYYFRVRTYTPPHGDQQNEVWSEYATTTLVVPRLVYTMIGGIEVSIIGTAPDAQIELSITGTQPDGCGNRVRVDQERDGHVVTVTIYRKIAPDTACPAVVLPYESIILLDGTFDEGTYTIWVNDVEVTVVVPPAP